MSSANPHPLPGSSARTDTGSTGSSSNSSTSSAIRYGLDETDTNAILAYHYGKCKIERTTQRDLNGWLEQNRQLRVSKKPIPRNMAIVEVQRHDLFLPSEKADFKDFPNYDSSLASIRLPFGVYCGRNLLGSYDQLYIVSPELSLSASVAGSLGRQDSDMSSFGYDSFTQKERPADIGAEKD